MNGKHIIEEYKGKNKLYREFSLCVKDILKHLLNTNKINNYAITNREKSIDSLVKKLQRKKYKKLDDCTDLAGVRIIFFVEDEKNRILSYIEDEFEIIEYVDKYKKDGYKAFHYIVRLKKDRLKLPEYKQFKKMSCEIQLSTILHHARSEFEHDIFYKADTRINDKFSPGFDKLKEDFNKLMEIHINDASYGFNQIRKRYQEFKMGVTLTDVDRLSEVANLISNKEIFDKILEFKKYFFLDSEASIKKYKGIEEKYNLTSLFKSILMQVTKNKRETYASYFGDKEVYDSDKICLVIIEFLGEIFQLDIDSFFQFFVRILGTYSNQSIHKRIVEIFTKNSKYKYFQLRDGYGYIIQKKLLNLMINNNLLNKNYLVVLDELLKLIYDGTELNGDKVTRYRGPLTVTDDLILIRQEVLKKIFDIGRIEIDERKHIINVLNGSCSMFFDGVIEPQNNAKLIAMRKSNIESIVLFYLEILDSSSIETIREIERGIESWEREIKIFGDIKNIKLLIKKISKNKDYMNFKVLTGIEPREDVYKGYDEVLKNINKKQDAYINLISYEQLEIDIINVINNFSERASYPYFYNFLFRIGNEKKDFAKKMIANKCDYMLQYTGFLLRGLWLSEKKWAKNKIKMFIENDNLLSCAEVFALKEVCDFDLLILFTNRALLNKDKTYLYNAIRYLSVHFELMKGKEKEGIKLVFWKIMYNLNVLKDTKWIGYARPWYESIIKESSKKQQKTLLANLLFHDKIDTHIERILAEIANTQPENIILFFQERIKISKRKKEYQSLPFDFYALPDVMATKATKVLPLLWKRFDRKDWKYIRDSRHLIADIFPGFPEGLQSFLTEKIKKGGKEMDYVLSVLGTFEETTHFHVPENTTWEEINKRKDLIYKQIAVKIGNDKGKKEDLMDAMIRTGVVTGELGFISIYEEKKKNMAAWIEDEKLKLFAEEYMQYIDKRILSERRRTDENKALREHGLK